MKMGSIRSLTIGLGAVGLIAACGGSNSTTSGFTPKKGGADASANNNNGNNNGSSSSGSSGSGDNNQNSGSSSGSGDDSGGSACANTACATDKECDTACGSAPGANCCAMGMCFASTTGTCDTEGGAGDDSGSPSPAPSM